MKKAVQYLILIMLFVYLPLNQLFAHQSAYKLYDSEGNEVSWEVFIENFEIMDVVFFGEMHNNPINHWLRDEIVKEISDKEIELIIGMEMFEADNQLIIDEYFSGIIRQNNFEREVRLWPNYKTDYKSLVEFALENDIPLIATNVPRRYAAMVAFNGIQTLEELEGEALEYMAPIPFPFDEELESYKKMLEMAGSHASENFIHAQALKDATMAHFINKNLVERTLFFHVNGSFHSDMYEGIVWYLNQYQPGLNILTISSKEQDDINELDEAHIGISDYIIVTPANMTKTY